jgi:hypothetical protein
MRRFVPKKSGSGDDTALLIGQPTASDYNGSGGGAVTPLQWLFGALAIGTLLAVIVAAAVIGSSVSTIDQHVNSLTTLTTSVNTSVGARVGGIATVILNGSCTAQPSIEARRTRAYNVRLANAFRQYTKPIDCHVSNGDESAYASTRFASFSKGLQHDSTLGHVLPSSYSALLKATATELPSDWDAVPLAPNASRKLTSPQSGSAYVNEGGDAQSFVIPPAPTFSSAEQAAELVENYWAALLRDVPFANYTTHPLAMQAVADLTAMSDYRGPLPITGQTLFRGTSPGSTVGPYLSQFFYLPCQFGANIVEQKIKTLAPGIDYMTNWTEYVRVQNGQTPSAAVTILPTPVYMDSGRDLSHWVHIDVNQRTQLFPPLFSFLNLLSFFLGSLPGLLPSHALPVKHGRSSQARHSVPNVRAEPNGVCHVWLTVDCSNVHQRSHSRAQGRLVSKVVCSPPSAPRGYGCSRGSPQEGSVHVPHSRGPAQLGSSCLDQHDVQWQLPAAAGFSGRKPGKENASVCNGFFCASF